MSGEVSKDVLDREGEWEIRVTIYRNGRRVGTCDQLGDNFDDTAYDMTTNLERHEVQMHQPKTRSKR